MKLSKALGFSAALLLALSFAGSASASTSFSSTAPVSFDNGNGWESSVDGFPGETFQVQAIVNNTSDTDFNAISIDRVGDGVPLQCEQFQEVTQSVSNYAIPFTSTFSQSIGSAPYVLKVYGVQNSGQDFNCDSANVVATYNLPTNRIITNVGDSNSGGSTGGTGSNSTSKMPDWFVAYLATQKPASTTPTPTPAPAPVVNTLCSQLASTMSGTQVNVYNSANIALQGFLLYQKESIPWLAQGASFGYFGPQTQAALSHFKSVNGCA